MFKLANSKSEKSQLEKPIELRDLSKDDFRYLTPEEVKASVVALSNEITNFVKKFVVDRFKTDPKDPAITSADGMQVAVAAMAAAEAFLVVEALKTGLPASKVLDIRERVFAGTVQGHFKPAEQLK